MVKRTAIARNTIKNTIGENQSIGANCVTENGGEIVPVNGNLTRPIDGRLDYRTAVGSAQIPGRVQYRIRNNEGPPGKALVLGKIAHRVAVCPVSIQGVHGTVSIRTARVCRAVQCVAYKEDAAERIADGTKVAENLEILRPPLIHGQTRTETSTEARRALKRFDILTFRTRVSYFFATPESVRERRIFLCV